MKIFRMIKREQPINQLLLVEFIISEAIHNYRSDLFNKKIRRRKKINEIKRKIREED